MRAPHLLLKHLSHRDKLGETFTSLGLAGKAVEVGTLYGTYASILLRSWPGHLYCVDPWVNQNESEYKDGANKADMRRIWEDVQQNVGRNPRCTLMRMMSLQGADKFEDGELSMAYLDANHSLESVRRDIAAWWPKVKVGGIFCGHDFFTRYDADTNSDAQTAVMELAERVGVYPHVTWCSSWFFLKTQELSDSYNGAITQEAPVDNSTTEVVAVLSVSHSDFHLAKKWLQWVRELAQAGDAEPYQLIVFGSKAMTEEMWQQLRDCANGIQPAPVFRATPEVYERGYAPSANYMFRTALECVEREYPGCATLWCEADTVPMRPSWVGDIQAEYRAQKQPFLGDFFKHPPGVAGIDHMIGNSVYSPDWRRLAPSLAILPEPKPEQGWDTLCAKHTVPQMTVAKTIQQFWRPPLPITRPWVIANIRKETALFHQCKDGSLIDVLCEESGAEMIPLSEPLPRYMAPAPEITVSAAESCAIMIVACKRDIEFLQYCLRSIQKYARGFLGVWLVVPEAERREFHFAEGMPGVTLVGFNERPGKGMLHHEVMICRADEVCREASTILHIDADCMAWREFTPADYIVGGKCILVRERYDWLTTRNPNRLLWRTCVERATGITPEWETMVRQGAVYPRALYPRVRQLVEAHTGQPFDEYVLSCENGWPQSYAEFPTLGAVAIRDMTRAFQFIDYDHALDGAECGVAPGTSYQFLYRPERDPIVEFWGHAGIARYKADADKFMRGVLPKFYAK